MRPLPVSLLTALATFTSLIGIACTGAVEGDLQNTTGATSATGGSGASAAGSTASDGGTTGTTGGESPGASAAGGGGASGAAGSSSSTGGAASEFPCDVQQLLATKCLLCHQVDPPGKLLTSADFRKASKSDPKKTVGEVALDRLGATGATRMPPAPLAAATDAEIMALSAWVQAGAMPSSCGTIVEPPPNPYDTPVVCTSDKKWTGGNEESPLMRPGGACISCHEKEGEGPRFAIAGTLYPTAHEPNDCNGVSSSTGAKVVITEANGNQHTLSVNAAGNFYLEARTFAAPYQAKVVYQGRERVMVEAQTSGDCNDCHTESGRENAPGRVFLP